MKKDPWTIQLQLIILIKWLLDGKYFFTRNETFFGTEEVRLTMLTMRIENTYFTPDRFLKKIMTTSSKISSRYKSYIVTAGR